MDKVAEVFAAAGLGALVFDNHNFGASEGEPRYEIDPWRQVGDYRDAISYASGLPEVDGERIGVLGSSYSGGHVLVLSAIDRRVKCIVSQVPLISGHRNARRLIRADLMAGRRRRVRRFGTSLPGGRTHRRHAGPYLSRLAKWFCGSAPPTGRTKNSVRAVWLRRLREDILRPRGHPHGRGGAVSEVRAPGAGGPADR